MKCLSVASGLLVLAIIALAVPFSGARATLVRTQVGSYDLATGKNYIYNLNTTPTPQGSTLTLTRPSDGTTQLSAYMIPCDRPAGGTGDQALVKMKENQHRDIDPVLIPFINYASNNNLRMTIKPLSTSRKILLFEDSGTLMIDEKNVPHNDAAKCQRD